MLDLLLELVFFLLRFVFRQLELVFRSEVRVYILFYAFGSFLLCIPCYFARLSMTWKKAITILFQVQKLFGRPCKQMIVTTQVWNGIYFTLRKHLNKMIWRRDTLIKCFGRKYIRLSLMQRKDCNESSKITKMIQVPETTKTSLIILKILWSIKFIEPFFKTINK